jgi:hypothetical protein
LDQNASISDSNTKETKEVTDHSPIKEVEGQNCINEIQGINKKTSLDSISVIIDEK